MNDKDFNNLDRFLKDNSLEAPEASPFEKNQVLNRIKEVESNRTYNPIGRSLKFLIPAFAILLVVIVLSNRFQPSKVDHYALEAEVEDYMEKVFGDVYNSEEEYALDIDLF